MPRSRAHSVIARQNNKPSAHAGLSKIVGRSASLAADVGGGGLGPLSAASSPLHRAGSGEAFLPGGCDRGIIPPRLPVIRGRSVAAVQAVARVAARAVENVRCFVKQVSHAEQHRMRTDQCGQQKMRMRSPK